MQHSICKVTVERCSIQAVQPDDSGRYVCIVTNEAGTARDFGQLTVTGKIYTLSLYFCITRCLLHISLFICGL